MDILPDISCLLSDGIDDLIRADKEYRALRSLESSLLGKLEAVAGSDLVEKLNAAQAEKKEYDQLFCFLQGLRLGVELLRL